MKLTDPKFALVVTAAGPLWYATATAMTREPTSLLELLTPSLIGGSDLDPQELAGVGESLERAAAALAKKAAEYAKAHPE